MQTKRVVVMAIAVVCVLAIVLMPSIALCAGGGRGEGGGSRGEGSRGGGKSAGAASKNEKYIVVRVGEPTGTGELQVIKQSDLRSLEKSTKEEDKKLKDDYKTKKKDATKNKDTSDLGKPPVSRTVKRVSPTFKSQEAADEWKQKNADKAEAKKPGGA